MFLKWADLSETTQPFTSSMSPIPSFSHGSLKESLPLPKPLQHQPHHLHMPFPPTHNSVYSPFTPDTPSSALSTNSLPVSSTSLSMLIGLEDFSIKIVLATLTLKFRNKSMSTCMLDLLNQLTTDLTMLIFVPLMLMFPFVLSMYLFVVHIFFILLLFLLVNINNAMLRGGSTGHSASQRAQQVHDPGQIRQTTSITPAQSTVQDARLDTSRTVLAVVPPHASSGSGSGSHDTSTCVWTTRSDVAGQYNIYASTTTVVVRTFLMVVPHVSTKLTHRYQCTLHGATVPKLAYIFLAGTMAC